MYTIITVDSQEEITSQIFFVLLDDAIKEYHEILKAIFGIGLKGEELEEFMDEQDEHSFNDIQVGLIELKDKFQYSSEDPYDPYDLTHRGYQFISLCVDGVIKTN